MGRWNLAGKTALITGAARGIGAATARELAARGANVVLTGLEPDELDSRVREIGPERALAVEADVTDRSQLDAAVAQAAARFGAIDIVIANAGIASYGSVSAIAPEAFEKTVEINLTSVYRTAASTIGHLRRTRGYFLAISSMTAFTPFAGSSAYVSSKAGVEAFAISFGAEERAHGVRVGSAHPAWIETDLVKDMTSDLAVFSKMRRWMPWPISATLTPAECAKQIADGIEGRRIRIYVPRSLALLYWLRPFLWSAAMRRLSALTAKRWMAELDTEAASLGRSTSARTQRLDLDDEAVPSGATPATGGSPSRSAKPADPVQPRAAGRSSQ